MFDGKINPGMTLNERLLVSGLMGQFDKAVEARDRLKLIEILKKVNIEQRAAEQTVTSIFSNPEKYGYKS
ncbi:MAG: hypothetical protein JNN05_06695 [Candidatus Omnitrophica bacterium]|nr:hypothetical protein [Candidatus Omnitrophota bacterium]